MLASAFLVPTAFAAPTQDVNESISRHHDPSKLIRMAASEMMKRQAEYQQDGQGWATCANGQFISFDGGIAYHYDQSTGNFYVTENGSIVWQTRVNSPCATQCDCLLTFQSDGNLVTVSTTLSPASPPTSSSFLSDQLTSHYSTTPTVPDKPTLHGTPRHKAVTI